MIDMVDFIEYERQSFMNAYIGYNHYLDSNEFEIIILNAGIIRSNESYYNHNEFQMNVKQHQ